MNKVLLHIMVCVSVLMVGCTKSGHPSEEGVPAITFDMGLDQTKALISPSNLNTAGSKIVVYDVHTSEKGLDQYLDAQYLEYRDAQWSFTKTSGGDVIQIPWTKKGTHDFLAYNVHDASANQSIPVEVLYNENYSTAKQQSLRVPKEGEWTLNLNNQFDFIYGSATRNIETDGYAPVPMNFKHLFAAVAVEVRNASTEKLTLTSLSFQNIKDKGYAEIGFAGDVKCTLSASNSTGLFTYNTKSEILKGESKVLYDNAALGNAFLIWPHSAADLANAVIEIKYKLGSNTTETKNTIQLSENYTVKTWLAGNKYKYLIAVTDEKISFDVIRVVEWINDDIILEE